MEIRITASGAERVPLAALNEFQGELKSLSKTSYEKLRREIKKEGFSFVVHVWKDPKGKLHILDGHQRIRTVRKMVEFEGFTCAEVPVAYVEAKDLRHAKRKLLAAASQYGETTEQGLYEFMSENEITPEELSASYEFADIDTEKFLEGHFGDDVPEEPIIDVTPAEPASVTAPRSPVRMVQIFFDEAHAEEFFRLADVGMAKFGRENLSDTILECMRASCTN